MDFDEFSMCGHFDAQLPVPVPGTATSSGFEVQHLDRDGDPPQHDIHHFFSSPVRSVRMGRGVPSFADSAVAHDRTRGFEQGLMSPPRPEAGRHPDGDARSPATASTWSNPGASVEEARASSTSFTSLGPSGAVSNPKPRKCLHKREARALDMTATSTGFVEGTSLVHGHVQLSKRSRGDVSAGSVRQVPGTIILEPRAVALKALCGKTNNACIDGRIIFNASGPRTVGELFMHMRMNLTGVCNSLHTESVQSLALFVTLFTGQSDSGVVCLTHHGISDYVWVCKHCVDSLSPLTAFVETAFPAAIFAGQAPAGSQVVDKERLCAAKVMQNQTLEVLMDKLCQSCSHNLSAELRYDIVRFLRSTSTTKSNAV